MEVTEQRTRRHFAYRMKDLVDVHFPQAEVIRVVLGNFNTHSPAALYEVFEPQEARRVVRKLEFHYTPNLANGMCRRLGEKIPGGGSHSGNLGRF